MGRHPSHDYLLRNASGWMDEFLDVLDVGFDPALRWDRRLRKMIAGAELWNDRTAVIRLSHQQYPVLSAKKRIEVIAHEVCHLAAWERHGLAIENHGPEWAKLMMSLGFEPLEVFELPGGL